MSSENSHQTLEQMYVLFTIPEAVEFPIKSSDESFRSVPAEVNGEILFNGILWMSEEG